LNRKVSKKQNEAEMFDLFFVNPMIRDKGRACKGKKRPKQRFFEDFLRFMRRKAVPERFCAFSAPENLAFWPIKQATAARFPHL